MPKRRATPSQASEVPLPMSRAEMEALGWDALDVLLVSGDAYVDHPSFGVALLGRWLVAHGFRVGIVAQPRWDSPKDVEQLGRPRLFAGVTAGTMDSMLAHYTAFRKLRNDDAYTPGGRHGARPNRASLVYANLVRQAFPGLPLVLGGVEASLRRVTHYDFWADGLRRSILLDSKADLLIYGMAERAILDVAERLRGVPPQAQHPARALPGIPGTAFAAPSLEALRALRHGPGDAPVVELPSHEAIVADAARLMEATLALELQVHQGKAWAVQPSGDRVVALAPPAAPLSTEEMDAVYALPFTRRAHPSYRDPIPAAAMIQFSVTSHRGCAGGCTFCSITLHQGRGIRSRSAESLRQEVETLTHHPDWTGSITDVGGPTANMWGARCTADPSTCERHDCLTPTVCPHFQTREAAQVRLLRTLQRIDGVKHLRVASGVRYDLMEGEGRHLRALVSEFVGGQLKVAPEHVDNRVLALMRKPPFERFEAFLDLFDEASGAAGKEQYIIPYLISAFPGCTDDDMRALARWLRERNWTPRQVQCFLPTPGTVATAMFYAGIDPKGHPIPVARTDKERQRQHGILMPRNRHAPDRDPRPPSRRSR